MTVRQNTAVAEIARLFETRGNSMYAGEPVTQTEHALQAAHLAEQSGATDAMISAALLHDVGHLLHNHGEDCADDGVNDKHEVVGEQWLKQFFGPDVCEPIRLHVPAKRYRCAVEPEYLTRLSPASVRSLELQGGLFSEKEVQAFLHLEHYEAALQLREWDETAKVPNLATPTIDHFLSHVKAVLK